MNGKRMRSFLFFSIIFSLTTVSAQANTIEVPFKKLFSGIASWYGGKFHGKRTASGSKYNMHQMTCAHKTLPFGTKLIVKNPTNGKTCQVTVTDRGPYHGSRVLDLSKAAADKLGLDGVGHVVCYLGKVVTKGIGETAKTIEGTAKETGETIASLPVSFGKVAKELSDTAINPHANGISDRKFMSKQALRDEIANYYANKTLTYEAAELTTLSVNCNLEPRAKTGCLLVPHRSTAFNNSTGQSLLAGFEQDIF